MMLHLSRSTVFAWLLVAVCGMSAPRLVGAQETPSRLHAKTYHSNPPNFDLLADHDWRAIESSVDRAIHWLVSNQKSNGSFPGRGLQNIAVTPLAAMAMLSRGHVPGVGPEGEAIDKAIDFVLRLQKPDGLLSMRADDFSTPQMYNAVAYCHAINGLFLCEVYGMTTPERSDPIKRAVDSALALLRKQQQRPIPDEREELDRGGWRYWLRPTVPDNKHSDLSITSWYVMFMRSAENAGFDVPYQWADEAINYVQRCYDKSSGGFHYFLHDPKQIGRGMTAAGVLCLFLTGNGDPEMERGAGNYLRQHLFDEYRQQMNKTDRYFYSCYYCSQASMQLGGETWATVYPSISRTLVANQSRDGSWDVDSKESWIGRYYSTSMAILSLTPPYQLLPIYQR